MMGGTWKQVFLLCLSLLLLLQCGRVACLWSEDSVNTKRLPLFADRIMATLLW